MSGWRWMTFQEWVASEATWWDRLRCRVLRHTRATGLLKSGDGAWCIRCGKSLPSDRAGGGE